MSVYYNFKFVFIFFFIITSQSIAISSQEAIPNHVICSFINPPKNQSERDLLNSLVHQATYQINLFCKKKYKNPIETNLSYQYHRDTVFFVHFNHNFDSWTLYKPSFIPFDDFIYYAKKIYKKHGIKVACFQDQLVVITKKNLGFDGQYMSLDEFEAYKKMSKIEFSLKISELEKDLSKNGPAIDKLKKAMVMLEFFFWHLQIPTTGLLPSKDFDIDNRFKPIAWNFSLWDLAPKKGEGAKVSIIDTGISAFNIQEKEFATTYKKHINVTMPKNDLQDYGYNLVSKDGLDPVRQITINFGNFCDHQKFNSDLFMRNIPEWIIDVVKNKKTTQIRNFFTKSAKKEYLSRSSESLNEKGEKVLNDLLFGRYGIAPYEKNIFFNVVNLRDPYNEESLLELLPAPKITGNQDPFSAGHGTFIQGVVNGKKYNELGISGIAPQAKVTMIKAFNDDGTTSKTTLNAALQRAITLKSSIVSMSLKITDSIDPVADAPLKKLIDSIDYVVAASGNDGTDPKLHNKEAYPARFDSVAFDVGAFKYDKGNYTICDFTQKEPGIGPKVVAPGFDILSAGLTPDQIDDSMFVFMAGTSVAVPVVTGFLALAVAEFQDIFTREQILKVIYKFTMRLQNNSSWNEDIILGTIDMRSALLCLHTLQSLQIKLGESFLNIFDNLVEVIHTINYSIPEQYSDQIKKSFISDFTGFIQEANSYKNSIKKIPSNIETKSLTSCIEDLAKKIINIINSKQETLQDPLQIVLKKTLTNQEINLFKNLSKQFQERISLALAARVISTTKEI